MKKLGKIIDDKSKLVKECNQRLHLMAFIEALAQHMSRIMMILSGASIV